MKKLAAVIIILSISTIAFFAFQNKNKTSINETKLPAEQKTQTPTKQNVSHPDSIDAMSKKEYNGSDLKLEKKLSENEFYTRYSISYKSEGFKISGIMNIPKGDGTFPILILNHGFIDPKVYTNGQGLKREQDFFARNGYAVLHSDYRNHAQSDFDPNNDLRPRSGYVEDVINAIEALKKSDLPSLNKENIGMLGHSMGGGIALNVMVTKPEIAKAYVLLAPINSDYKKNFDRWVLDEWPNVAKEFYEKYGTYEENTELWKSISARYYLDKIKAPIMLHQGALDEDVPVEWSRELNELLKKEGKDITYFEYPKEGHTFFDAQQVVMQRSLDFFNENLKK